MNSSKIMMELVVPFVNRKTIKKYTTSPDLKEKVDKVVPSGVFVLVEPDSLAETDKDLVVLENGNFVHDERKVHEYQDILVVNRKLL